MTILNNGLNRVRDLHYDDVDEVDFGDDGTATSFTQTGVIGPIAGATALTITKTKGVASNQFNAKLDSTTGVGSTVREFSFGNATVDYDRTVIPGVAHTANDEVIVIKTYLYERG